MRNRLKVLRAERDWTQQRLARELGVSRQTVNAIEKGKFDPSLPLAFRIAAVFGGRIEEIFFPDAGDRGDYALVEVKGPGDQIQKNQMRWLGRFSEMGVPAFVLWVEWQDPEE